MSSDDLFTRNEVFNGLPAKRASALLFEIERYTARLRGQTPPSAPAVEPSAISSVEPQAPDFFNTIAQVKTKSQPVTIADLELYSLHWAALVPNLPDLRASLAHLLGLRYSFTTQDIPQIRNALSLDEAAVRQAYEESYGHPLEAIFAPAQPEPADQLPAQSPRLSTWDKVQLLKSTSLFFETPDDVVTDVVQHLSERQVEADEMIFAKGDPGSCMYFIAAGRVRVFDGERTINVLGRREIFGEMAALDPEPRSASVMAIDETLLLQFDQEPLYELMAHRPEVLRGVIHILNQRLRARVRDMAEDYKYIQQFNRVTSAAAALESGVYDPDSLIEVAQRPDELGILARVFQRTIREVQAREHSLRQQVAELRIEIDQAQQAQQAADIADSDYFQGLRRKTGEWRAARRADQTQGE
jgi:CRP/FNR family transcriptional regulator, cyclic AMP receptor protein